MSAATAAVEPEATTLSPRLLAWIGIAVGVLATLVTVPPLLVETPLVPVLLGIAAIAIGGVAVTRGERFLGAYAVAAGVLGVVCGILVQTADADTVQKVVAAGLFTGMLTLRHAARVRGPRRTRVGALRRHQHRPRGHDADGLRSGASSSATRRTRGRSGCSGRWPPAG